MKLTAMLAMFAAMPSFAAESQLDPLAPTARWTAYTAGRAQTPPMGWSSWNAFATDIDEDRIVGSAQALVASVTFRVYGDGKALATSRALQWGSAGQQLSVDVAGVNIIELVARAAGDDSAALPVTWAEAALLSR